MLKCCNFEHKCWVVMLLAAKTHQTQSQGQLCFKQFLGGGGACPQTRVEGQDLLNVGEQIIVRKGSVPWHKNPA